MSDNEDQFTPEEYKKIALFAIVAVCILCILTIGSYVFAKNRGGQTILPGGVTYLGPTPTPLPSINTSTITISNDAKWIPYQGKLFPYSFNYPSSLSLGVFPNDPFDGVTIFWGNTNAQENIFLRVEDLNKLTGMSGYIQKSKKEYANIWWKQYNWKGVASIEEFTNAKGMKGYKAKYVNENGQTPFINYFFEIPGRKDLVLWMASRLLDENTFSKIIDSVQWNTQQGK